MVIFLAFAANLMHIATTAIYRERERELRREGGESFLAYFKGVGPYHMQLTICNLQNSRPIKAEAP